MEYVPISSLFSRLISSPPDPHYPNTFLLTYRMFTNAHEVLDALLEGHRKELNTRNTANKMVGETRQWVGLDGGQVRWWVGLDDRWVRWWVGLGVKSCVIFIYFWFSEWIYVSRKFEIFQ